MSWYPVPWKTANPVPILFPPLVGCIAICCIFIGVSCTCTVYDKGQLFLKSSDFYIQNDFQASVFQVLKKFYAVGVGQSTCDTISIQCIVRVSLIHVLTLFSP